MVILGVSWFMSGLLFCEKGVSGGFVLSRVSVSGQSLQTDMKNLTDLTIGGFYNFPFTEKLSFQGELRYTRKGFKQVQALGNDKNIVKLKLQYLEIPLMVKYSFPVSETLIPYVVGGGYASLKLHAKNYAYTEGSNTQVVTDMDEFFNRIDLGILGGVGVKYQWNDFMCFNLEARYCLGFKDIYKDTGSTNVSFKNRSFYLLLGVSF